MNDMKNKLNLKNINDLLEENFIIPSYQRGFRWTERQVKELLNDIMEFSVKEKSKGEFYCIQPLIVTQKEDINLWEVIDGQQRLTTIYLILNYFNQRLTKENRKRLFTINYQTRTKSKEFLQNPNADLQDENIDYYHIYKANKLIKDWFSDKTNLINDFESALLNRTKFIWYEVQITGAAEAINIFTRINIGKIPLTNAELIKALFLNRSNFENDTDEKIYLKQLQIATEWDRIEHTLQNDSFWYFIYEGKNRYPTRIEYIFDLLVGTKTNINDSYYTFISYKQQFEVRGKNIDKEWKIIKDFFLTFDEWYNDKVLYHLIGFLISDGYNILNLKAKAQTLTKSEFVNFLSVIIRDRLNCKTEDIENLDYENDKSKIKSLLLLLNIETIVSNPNSNIKFPFNKFKTENWNIEHIRAVKSNKPIKEFDKRHWLSTILGLYDKRDDGNVENNSSGSELHKLIYDTKNILNKEKLDNDTDFDNLYFRWLDYFHENDEPEYINNIGNLTLLDEKTNKSYKNALFVVKRQIIIGKDKTATFVPLCTKNVFLKYYSPIVRNMLYWSEDDKNNYINAITETLNKYLKQDNTGNGN